MSLLSKLAPKEGSTHYRKRVGRGIGSGLGGFSGKGGKGQTQRSGGSIRRGFEGGQTPLYRRLPKFGFKNVDFGTRFQIVNLASLGNMASEVTPESLREAGLISRNLPIKILGDGELTKALSVKAHGFSKKAKEMIEKAGGKTEVVKL